MADLGDLIFRIIAKDEATATVGDAAARIGQAGMAVGAGITAVGVAATSLIDANRQMDASFATTALSMGVPAEAVKELARSLQSVDSPIEEVAATLDVLGRAGMSNVESMRGTASAFDTLADAIGAPADTLTSAMVPAFNALGIELADAPQYVDGLATTFRTANVDMGDFSALMTKVGPDLGQMGLGLQDVEAIMMSFADRGITGRKATSELGAAIKDADGDVSKLYASLGITTTELEGYNKKLDSSEGSAQKFADAQNSAFGTMDKLGFVLTTVKQNLGDVLKPFEGVATAAMGLGPAVTVASGAMSMLGNETVQKLVPSLGKVVTGIAGAGGLAPALLALATGPVGIAIAAIVAIGAAILLLDTQFHFIAPTIEWFGEAFKAIGDWLGTTFGPIIDGVIGFFGELGTQLGGTGDIVKDVMGWFGDLGQSVMEIGGQIGEFLGPAIQALATLLGGILGQYIKDRVADFQTLGGLFMTYVLPALQGLWDAFAGFCGWLAATLGPAIEGLIGALGKVGDAADTISSPLGFLAEKLGIVKTGAEDAGEPMRRFGDHTETAGKKADGAKTPVKSLWDNIFGAGEAASTADPQLGGMAKSLDKIKDAAYDAKGALIAYIDAAGRSVNVGNFNNAPSGDPNDRSTDAYAEAARILGQQKTRDAFGSDEAYKEYITDWKRRLVAKAKEIEEEWSRVSWDTGTSSGTSSSGGSGTSSGSGGSGAQEGTNAVPQGGAPLFSDYEHLADGIRLYQEAYAKWLETVTGTPAAVAPASAAHKELGSSVGTASSAAAAAQSVVGSLTTAVNATGSAASGAAPAIGTAREAINQVGATASGTGPILTTLGAQVTAAGAAATGATPPVNVLATSFGTVASSAVTADPNVGEMERAMIDAGLAAIGAAPAFGTSTQAINATGSAANAAASPVDTAANRIREAGAAASSAAPAIRGTGSAFDVAASSARSMVSAAQTAWGAYRSFVDGVHTTPAWDAVRPVTAPAKTKRFHTGGVFEAPGGGEGMALLLSGERVLSPAESRAYESGAGIAEAVAAGVAQALSSLGLAGRGDVNVHGDVKLSADYSYEKWREDVGRWATSRTAKGMII